MATTSLILGESGTGKSTSLRYLSPASTFIISVIDKPLPFKNSYKRANGGEGNFLVCDNYLQIIKTIQYINSKRPEIKTLILDDFQYVMAKEFMQRATEKGYDKFTELAQHAWQIIEASRGCREELNIYYLTHSDRDESGMYKVKTIGRLLNEKITLEGLFTIVLHTLIIDGEYKFLTQNDGLHIAKSPIDLFDTTYIDNDLNFVNKQLALYYGEDINMEGKKDD